MRRPAFLLVLLCVACSPGAPNPQFFEALAKFDADFHRVKSEHRRTDSLAHSRIPDMRGRTMMDDFDQWVLTPESLGAVRQLRERALQRGSVASLDEARLLLRAEGERSLAIQRYWGEFPAPFWREHWRRFAQANEMPSLPPPVPLLEAERQLVAQLDAGNFPAAATEGAPRLVAEFRAAMKEVIPVVMNRRRAQQPRFHERGSPCGDAVAPDRNRANPRILDGPPVDSFYPEVSKKRGDEGTVVLRLRISDQGCVRAAAIVVHSGYEELDSAALQWMETAQYSPGFENGRAVAGQASVKVIFKMED